MPSRIIILPTCDKTPNICEDNSHTHDYNLAPTKQRFYFLIIVVWISTIITADCLLPSALSGFYRNTINVIPIRTGIILWTVVDCIRIKHRRWSIWNCCVEHSENCKPVANFSNKYITENV